MAETVHRLRVTLRDVEPPVWRRIAVASDVTLGELGAILEPAMGWLGYHLHLFEIGEDRYGIPGTDGGPDELDENRFRLHEVLPEAGARMLWAYDFGDGWRHDVVVEAIEPADRGVDCPVCLAGERACPPEDCGGVWGYAEVVEVLADPDHPDPNGLREWIPEGFDPERFVPEDATAGMRAPRPALLK